MAVGLMIDKTTLLSTIRIPYLSVTPSATPLPTPTPDPTANWKTYTDPNGHFTFKYPTSYSLETETMPYLHRNITWRFNNISALACRGDCPIINTKEQVTLGEKSATKLTGYIGSVGGNIPQTYVTYELVSGTKYFIFSMQALPFVMTKDEVPQYDPYATQQIKREDQLTFDQILSTFKFIDQTPTPTCRPRPACLDTTPRCLIPETSDMCPKATPAPSSTYACPPGGYVDCMPGPDPKPQCSAEAMAWYKANCPDFQGGAL
jgi:hypothetical protein